MNRRPTITQAITLAFAIVASPHAIAAHARYRIEAIGLAPDHELFQNVESVGGLNNRGEVACIYSHSIQITPTSWRSVSDSFLYTPQRLFPVPALGSQDVRILDLTDTGLMVGEATSTESNGPDEVTYSHQQFISQHGATTTIPALGGRSSYAAAANNQGDVAGVAWSPQEGTTAFKWNAAAGFDNLGNFGGVHLDAIDVNERGDVLLSVVPDEILQYGEHYLYQGVESLIYSHGMLSSLPRTEHGILLGEAINDMGVVVGAFSTIPGVETHAFMWDDGSGFRDIGNEGEFSYAVDVNNAGVVIGAFADAYQQPATPFVYTEQDGRHPLFDLIDNPEGWSGLESATHINDRGQIAGIGVGYGGFPSRRIFLLTLVPEPATALLLGLGACMVLSTHRRARRPILSQ